MGQVKHEGQMRRICGDLPAIGSIAPNFVLTDTKLQDHTLEDFSGKRKLLAIVPSLDTGVCALSARKFNEAASRNPDIKIIMVSADLPFAQKRVCEQDGLRN